MQKDKNTVKCIVLGQFVDIGSRYASEHKISAENFAKYVVLE